VGNADAQDLRFPDCETRFLEHIARRLRPFADQAENAVIRSVCNGKSVDVDPLFPKFPADLRQTTRAILNENRQLDDCLFGHNPTSLFFFLSVKEEIAHILRPAHPRISQVNHRQDKENHKKICENHSTCLLLLGEYPLCST
jgi:hypothetical protein